MLNAWRITYHGAFSRDNPALIADVAFYKVNPILQTIVSSS